MRGERHAIFRISAARQKRADLLFGPEAPYPLAKRNDLAGTFQTKDRRGAGGRGIGACPLKKIRSMSLGHTGSASAGSR